MESGSDAVCAKAAEAAVSKRVVMRWLSALFCPADRQIGIMFTARKSQVVPTEFRSDVKSTTVSHTTTQSPAI